MVRCIQLSPEYAALANKYIFSRTLFGLFVCGMIGLEKCLSEFANMSNHLDEVWIR